MAELLRGVPRDPIATAILAHGASEPMDSPALDAISEGLVGAGVTVVRFEFAYMEWRRSTGRRRPPDRIPRLAEEFRSVVGAVESVGPLILGGRSMGGRVASLLADEVGADGLLLLSYPFHPPRRPERTRTAHLETLRTPTLIVQGDRDPFGTPDEVASYRLSSSIEVVWIPDGDHSLIPRKRSGRSPDDNLALAMSAAIRFVRAAT